MAELIIYGYGTTDDAYQFADIVSYQFQSDRLTPVDSFVFASPDPMAGRRVLRVEVIYLGRTIFKGNVDNQSTTFDSDGEMTTFECRQNTALLIDNEVKPTQYASFSTLDLLQYHGYPFGIMGHQLTQNCTFREISASKGMSHWEFIVYFCTRAYGSEPYLDRYDRLTLAPFDEITHNFTNEGDGTPYLKAVVTEDRYPMISKLYVKTGEDDFGSIYNYELTNALATSMGITRERYYNPSTLWENDIKISAADVIKQAQRDCNQIALTLPVLLDATVGDRATFYHSSVSKDDLYVAQVCHYGDCDGEYTTLLLWDCDVV